MTHNGRRKGDDALALALARLAGGRSTGLSTPRAGHARSAGVGQARARGLLALAVRPRWWDGDALDETGPVAGQRGGRHERVLSR